MFRVFIRLGSFNESSKLWVRVGASGTNSSAVVVVRFGGRKVVPPLPLLQPRRADLARVIVLVKVQQQSGICGPHRVEIMNPTSPLPDCELLLSRRERGTENISLRGIEMGFRTHSQVRVMWGSRSQLWVPSEFQTAAVSSTRSRYSKMQ